MKRYFYLVSLLILTIVSCSVEPDLSSINESKVTYLGEEICCANFQINHEEIASRGGGYHNDMLMAVNVDVYIDALDIQAGDSLTINYIFTEKEYQCMTICNRPDGLKIELMAAKKH